ncbi:hypothetical protein N7507_009322 [Penicillium longicatenatum]|nr:hypothetical protein N7507_009322 [Penicillium longicatenatum]
MPSIEEALGQERQHAQFPARTTRRSKVDSQVLEDAGDDAQQIDVGEISQIRETTGEGPDAGINRQLVNKASNETEDRDVGQVNVITTLLNAGCLSRGNVDSMGASNGEGFASAGGGHREEVHARGQGQLICDAVENGLDVNLGKIQQATGEIVDGSIDGKLVDESADNVQEGDTGEIDLDGTFGGMGMGGSGSAGGEHSCEDGRETHCDRG